MGSKCAQNRSTSASIRAFARQVYYCPQMQIHDQASLPNLFLFFPLFREILLRERIQIVHGHQTTSALAHECILHARTMGCKAVYTDHSLFGFANTGSIHLNKLMKFTLSDIDHVICVSHCRCSCCSRAMLISAQTWWCNLAARRTWCCARTWIRSKSA